MDYRPSKGANNKGMLIFVMISLSLTFQQAVKAYPVVLFMKGDPEAPRCGFSRAVSQVVAAYEVPKDKLKTYDVLADPELRQSIKEYSYVALGIYYTFITHSDTGTGQPYLSYMSTASLLVDATSSLIVSGNHSAFRLHLLTPNSA